MRIILIEDEPAAMRHLKSIIELKCQGFEIVDTAENGAEGLEKIQKLKPDVVITDVKMPIMDGIKLVSHIKHEFPNIYSIIVSGYQDFEYAKGAIQSGVVDYLLKPVNVEQLKILLESIHLRLERDYYFKRINLLKGILAGKQIETSLLNRYLPNRCISAAIVRENGLPSRFGTKNLVEYRSPLLERCMENNIKVGNNIWALAGRDENEVIFVHSLDLTNSKDFKEYIGEVTEQLDNGYHTTVFISDIFDIQELKRYIADLYRVLDNSTVIGYSQTIHGLSDAYSITDKQASFDRMLANKISFLVSNAMYDELKQEFIRLFALWEKEKRTQLWVENNLRQIFQIIEKHSTKPLEYRNYDVECLLSEALCYSASFGELMENSWELIERIARRNETKCVKVDTPAFFNSIERYMEQNISEPLSLPVICKSFGISQTYLSRLFRKYKNMSFNDYITTVRIEKAKQLILENPDMNLKDVASIVGYNDQFYFSRVFRSVTGVPPSEYV